MGKNESLKRYWSLLLIAAGGLLLMIGAVYWVVAVGIRLQDRSPEVIRSVGMHKEIVPVFWWAGGLLFVAGLVVSVVKLIGQSKTPPSATSRNGRD
jgi:hypothetical protein